MTDLLRRLHEWVKRLLMSCNCSDSQLYGKCCCQECLPPQPSQGPQGVPGEKGDPGTPGQNGVNSYTEVESAGTVPAVGNTVVLSVANAQWVVDGQNIYIEGIGYYEVQSHTATTITAKNTGAPGNASPGGPIPVGAGVGPAGYEGSPPVSPLPISEGGTGEDNATDAFTALSPITTEGDIIFGATGGVPARLAADTDGKVLTLDSGVPSWQTNSPDAANITGTLAVANGGTGASSASGARTNLGAAGVAATNGFTGDNTFSVAANTERFRVLEGLNVLVDIQQSPARLQFASVGGTYTLDIQNGKFGGIWNGFQAIKKVNVTSSSYSINYISSEEHIFASQYSLTGASSITLPSAGIGTLADGTVVTIIDAAGNASTYPITINRGGSDTIMGATSYVISNNYGGITLIYNLSTTNWVPLP